MARLVAILAASTVLLVAGCGDDDPPAVQGPAAQTTAPAPPAPAATQPPATEPVATQPPATDAPATQPPAAQSPTSTQPLEVPREQVVEQSKQRARKARDAGARSCPPIGQPDAGVVDITAKGVSCETARGVISSTDRDAKRGFVCEITSESFSDVPTVAFSCKRPDGAQIAYTAVG